MRHYWLKLLLLNILIFPLEFFLPLVSLFALIPSTINVHPWCIITAAFLHADFPHLFYNMFSLALFGVILEKIIGSKKFLVVYFSSAVVANIASLIAYPNSVSLGASGAIMGIIGILTVLRPKMMVYWGGAPLPMIFLGIMYIVIDTAGLFAPSNIGHAAHLAGFFVGVLYGLYWRKGFDEGREIQEKVKFEIDDDDLSEWEKTYM